MTLRIAAALSLGLGITVLLGFLHLLGEGPFATAEAAHLRAMKDRREAPADPRPIGFPAIDSLPSRLPLKTYAAIERRGVTIEGYIQYMLRASDGDIHLELTEQAPALGSTDNFYVTAEITPQWSRRGLGWRYPRLLDRFHPDGGGNVTAWGEAPRRVRLTGWLLYDWQYDPPHAPGALPVGTKRVSGWEVHPVTGIEVWDEARGGFVAVAR